MITRTTTGTVFLSLLLVLGAASSSGCGDDDDQVDAFTQVDAAAPDAAAPDAAPPDASLPDAGPTCASLLTPDLSSWSESYAAVNPEAAALYACACGAETPCGLVCNDPAHPSFCMGVGPVAGGQCETCIKTVTGASGCADQYQACGEN